MSWRYLPPAYSPVKLAGLLSGMGGLVGGDARARLVQSLLDRYGASQVELVDSGTSALRLAITESGGPVALPAWGCYDLATACDGAHAEVLLYDLDPTTLGPDWASLDQVLGQGVATVVAVHPFGIPVDLPEVHRRAARSGARVIEDAAQAIGGAVAGRPAGGGADWGVLSFGRGKGWTGGGGGALLRRAKPSAQQVPPGGRGARELVMLGAQWLLTQPALYRIPASIPALGLGRTVYHEPHSPTGMTSASAAIALAAIPQLQPEHLARQRHARLLTLEIERHEAGSVPAGWSGGTPGLLRLPLLPTDPVLAAAITPRGRSLGITPGYPIALPDLPGFDLVRNREAGFPGARLLARRLVTLPVHSLLTATDLGRLSQWIRSSAA